MKAKPNKIKLCKQKGCRDAGTTEGYCRKHYIQNWKEIVKKKKLSQEKQDKFIAMMADKYTDDVFTDDTRDEIIGKHSSDNLSEMGIKVQDFKKDSDDNPFANLDIDVMIKKMKYDEQY